MNENLKKDIQNLPELMNAVLASGTDYLTRLDEIPTSVNVPFEEITALDQSGSGSLAALDEFRNRFEKIMVASAGPRYWGFVTGGSTPAAIMGDILATVYDQNPQAVDGHGDISARVEFEAVRWLRELFGLPDQYLGGFVTGATMSNFTCLGVARQWIGNESGQDFARNGLSGEIPVLAAVPHSSSVKALAMLGIGSGNIRKVPVINPTREAIDIAELEQTIQELNGKPFILLTSGGTVNTVDFDDFRQISSLRKKYSFWWHIDAAFGAFAALSSQHSHLLNGWEEADSITIDGHKWLNVPYESAFFFIQEKHKFLQVATYQNSNAPYLGDPLENFNYLNFLPENSRRLKALPAWFTLRAYGRDGYREIVERNIRLAALLGEFIEKNEHFRLLAPVRLNTVCFSLAQPDGDNVREFLQRLNARGKVYMTPTIFQGHPGIRAALVNWRTSESDILTAQDELLRAL